MIRRQPTGTRHYFVSRDDASKRDDARPSDLIHFDDSHATDARSASRRGHHLVDGEDKATAHVTGSPASTRRGEQRLIRRFRRFFSARRGRQRSAAREW